MVIVDRYTPAHRAALAGIAVNVVLTIAKGFAGIASGSQAVLADAFHSASDIVASAVVLVSLRVAHLPPDESHPYGHGKAESIAAKIVAIILLLVGLKVAWDSVHWITVGKMLPPGPLAFWAALGSIAVKEILFRFTVHWGRRLRSPALVANAWEHRSDVYSSFGVLAGITLARLGPPLGIPWMGYLDPLAGFVVALLILKMGWSLIVGATLELMDTLPERSILDQMCAHCLEVNGVMEVQQIRARHTGSQFLVDLKIAVNGDLSVREGHAIAARVKQRLIREMEAVADVLVHVNPAPVKEAKPGGFRTN
ncbi:MAG: cation transporter [Firmicutes bacterium]|nr:cation transporter [Bacillota bacterium]